MLAACGLALKSPADDRRQHGPVPRIEVGDLEGLALPPLVLFESGFAPRWYVPRADVAADALHQVEGQTFCPYKGVASYYDIGEVRNAAWSYRAPFEEMARIADLVSFEPDKVTITIDGEKLEPLRGQTVLPHGPDRNLSVDEIGGVQLVEPANSEGPSA